MGKVMGKNLLKELAHDFSLNKERIKISWNSTIKLIIIYHESKVSQTSDRIDDDTWTQQQDKKCAANEICTFLLNQRASNTFNCDIDSAYYYLVISILDLVWPMSLRFSQWNIQYSCSQKCETKRINRRGTFITNVFHFKLKGMRVADGVQKKKIDRSFIHCLTFSLSSTFNTWKSFSE